MLMPKRTKYRKMMKGRNRGYATRGNSLTFGDFGITFEGQRERGLFSSNRGDARGWDHIYSFEYPTFTMKIDGYVSDVDEVPIDKAIVRIVGRDGMNRKIPVKKDGSYSVELARGMDYVMMAEAPNYLNQNFELKTEAEEKNGQVSQEKFPGHVAGNEYPQADDDRPES